MRRGKASLWIVCECVCGEHIIHATLEKVQVMPRSTCTWPISFQDAPPAARLDLDRDRIPPAPRTPLEEISRLPIGLRVLRMHRHRSALTPIEVARPAGRVQRAGPARRRRAENGGTFFFCVGGVGSALVRTRTAGSAEQRCVVHGDCQDGFFCGVSLSDSYEGWLYQASFCRPCSQCGCHHESSTAKCPADRFACLFAPHASRFRVKGRG